jgi:quercetin dioxygenase-like cupin family protein
MAVFMNSYREAAAFRPERFNPVVVAENERVKVIEACFEPGQFIPVHQPGVDLTLTVLEGTGSLVAGEREAPLVPGTVAFVPAGEARGIRATTRLVLLHVVTPPPTEVDHVQVASGLKRGTWQ